MNGVQHMEHRTCGTGEEEKGHESDVVVSGDDMCHLA
jgi:hypothetical protein